ncbi:hypothetical protein HPT27_05930 [Permianibacter sp. IMCC34836]|uniref:hypothetical protein n=1 Tax=Permianibacter fluminis TaxID=2738515 RepID=UPI0015574755|nr:hypothetical protein [Permianibacter fluminis]NQD36556.1 hypothetical protein [Permianibacter fluminis]
MIVRPLLLTAVLLMLSACSLLPGQRAETVISKAAAPDLSTQLAEAEAALAEQPNDSGLKEKVGNLRRQTTLLETDHLSKAEKLWAGQQPGAAIAELDVGLLSLPGSSALQRRRTYYRELLDRRLEMPRAELRLVRGRYVADALRVQKQIQQLAPNQDAATLAALEQERQALMVEISALGQKALERKQYGFARWSYNIAADLGAPDASKWLTEIGKREQQKTKKVTTPVIEPELSEQQVLEARRSTLKKDLQAALDRRDLGGARQQLTELQQLFPTDPDASKFQQTLKPLAKEQVKVLQADGNRRYRDGDIAGALAAWKQALALEPDNRELPPLIERAAKVQSNLDSLRERK